MKAINDRATDSLVIMPREAPIEESDEGRSGLSADFGEDGGAVRFEVLRGLAGRRGHRAGAVRHRRLIVFRPNGDAARHPGGLSRESIHHSRPRGWAQPWRKVRGAFVNTSAPPLSWLARCADWSSRLVT